MSELSRKDLDRFSALLSLSLGGSTPGEREAAHAKLLQWLERHDKTLGDIPELAALAARETLVAKEAEADNLRRQNPEGPSPFAKKFSCLDQVHRLLEWYTDMREHEHVAVALWVLHTHVYHRFDHTPRLALMSPSEGCGKSRTYNVIEQLCAHAQIVGGGSAASIFRLTDNMGDTILIDEGDTLKLLDNQTLRQVINDGHEPGRPITRVIGGDVVRFNTFTPMALAAIGNFPVTIMKRAIIVHMRKPLPSAKIKVWVNGTRHDHTWVAITEWANKVELEVQPQLPPGISNRVADNWRPLISIADSFGSEWGARARKAAIAFQGDYTDNDIAVQLLYDIRTVFRREALDVIGTVDLVHHLIDLDELVSWGAFGPQSHKLTTSEMSRLLSPWRIKSKSVWAKPRLPGASSIKSYYREQFEDAWARWCQEPETAAPKKPTLRVVETEPWDRDEDAA